jgi:pimeloyl-ACP methyl ester carboxylesterase
VLAARKPEMVKALILSGTLHRTNARTRQVIEHWLELIRQNSWYDFVWSYFAYTYRPQTIRRYRLFKPLFVRMRGAARHPERIQNLLTELLTIDNRRLLPDIQAPTLVIGGQEDRIIPAEIQREMGDLITNSRIKLFPGFGHGNDQENPAYEGEIDKFIHRNLGV